MIGVASASDGLDHAGPTRRRVMIVSAKIGGGHDATGRALQEAIERRWPGSTIRWVDTLDRMGPGVGPGFRWIYSASVEHAPWLYDFFYGVTWRWGWLARASKRVTGSWAGRRLADEISAFAPDMVLSTYPLGSAGLAWLRRHRGLAVPTAAWVSDFSPHPFWVYADVDTTLVVHEAAVVAARLAEPEARLAVSALPVVEAFRPGDKQAARERLGLRADALVVLVSCGTFGFGLRDSVVHAILGVDQRIQLVAVCGHNQRAAERLRALGYPSDRLVVLGWVEDMPLLNQAADVVVTNAGGATALEAMAMQHRVLMVEPIPAHGVANASLMTVAGLAELCASEEQLADRIRAVMRSVPAPPAAQTRDHASRSDELADDLAEIAEKPLATEPTRPWPMRPADAFFAHVEETGTPQQIGVLIELGRTESGGRISLADLRRTVSSRLSSVPPLRWQPMRRGKRLGWRLWRDVDVSAHISEQWVGGACEEASDGAWSGSEDDGAEPVDPMRGVSEPGLEKLLDEFWAAPLPSDRPAWTMLLVHLPQRSLLAVKVHHCLGDGLSALGILRELVDEDQGVSDPAPASPPAASRQTEPGPGSGLATQVTQAFRGLWHLARHGPAPRHPMTRRTSASRGSHADGPPAVVFVPLPAAELRQAARQRSARTFEIVLAIVAETLDRLLRPAGLLAPGAPLRAFVPLRAGPRLGERISGNWTTAVPVDLPMGPMSPKRRLAAIREKVHGGVARGEPLAASLVMRTVGRLPASAHAWFARHAYTDRFLNLVVSYIPGPRGRYRLAGAPVHGLYPIAPLTRGVPLSVGVVATDRVAGVGMLVDPVLGLDRAMIATTLHEAFRVMVED